jgi:hypothetical protein
VNRCECCGMVICRHCGRAIERFDVGWSHYVADAEGRRSYRDRCAVAYGQPVRTAEP